MSLEGPVKNTEPRANLNSSSKSPSPFPRPPSSSKKTNTKSPPRFSAFGFLCVSLRLFSLSPGLHGHLLHAVLGAQGEPEARGPDGLPQLEGVEAQVAAVDAADRAPLASGRPATEKIGRPATTKSPAPEASPRSEDFRELVKNAKPASRGPIFVRPVSWG